jgi:hypothetical protein
MKGNVVICNSSVEKDVISSVDNSSLNLVMHANVLWRHAQDVWSCYEPFRSESLHHTQFFVSTKDAFPNRTTTTKNRYFYHFQIEDQAEFSMKAIQNMNEKCDLAFRLLGLHNGTFGMTIPPGMMFQYDHRTIVPKWTLNFGSNTDAPLDVVLSGTKLFQKLFSMRWKLPQDYNTMDMDWLSDRAEIAGSLIKCNQSSESSKAQKDSASQKLNTDTIESTKYTAGVPYTLHDIYRVFTIGECLTDNHINAHFALLRHYNSYRVSSCEKAVGRKYSLFLSSFFMAGLIYEQKGFSVTKTDYVHRHFQKALKEVMGSLYTPQSTIADIEMIMVPTNIRNYHWVLPVVFMKERTIRFWDPIINGASINRGEKYNVTDARRICSALLAAIIEECRITKCNSDALQREEWKFVIMTNAPHQGANECGDYICLFADLLCDHLPVQSCSMPKQKWLQSCYLPTFKGKITAGYSYRLKMVNDVMARLQLSYCDDVR